MKEYEEFRQHESGLLISEFGAIDCEEGTAHLVVSSSGRAKVRFRGEWYSVHRLVYELFVGPIEDGFEIHHIDGYPGNNFYQNLQSLSPSDHRAIHRKA